MAETEIHYIQGDNVLQRHCAEEFRPDTVDTTEGYNAASMSTVSRRFNGMNEREKQAFIWDLYGQSAQTHRQFPCAGVRTDEL